MRKGSPPGQAWRREPGGPFDDLRREDFAQARAKGANIKAAGKAAQLGTYQTALEWSKHPDMLGRIRELRQGAEDFVGASIGYVIEELKRNVRRSRKEKHFKSSNEALGMIYKIISTDPTVRSQVARALPPQASGQNLQAALRNAFSAPAVRIPRAKPGAQPPAKLPPTSTFVDTTGEEEPPDDGDEDEAAE